MVLSRFFLLVQVALFSFPNSRSDNMVAAAAAAQVFALERERERETE